MLRGKIVNLRIIEQDDFDIYTEWINSIEIMGKYLFGTQRSLQETMEQYGTRSREFGTFVIEKKDGTRIGILHFFDSKFGGYAKSKEVGFFLIPEERGNGFCTEAVGLVLDYLFLIHPLERIQAVCATTNIASRRVLEKSGFRQEGTLRRLAFFSGKHMDISIFSIIREEWSGPNLLGFDHKR
ncbi:MAG: GNAT family N-acetyltransferase [Candidatus Thorarchaeota archaeon]|nr:MAG: GNAT family N-acetyltransferase [Candidatus Thorarchaeota archaeon]